MLWTCVYIFHECRDARSVAIIVIAECMHPGNRSGNKATAAKNGPQIFDEPFCNQYFETNFLIE